MDESLKQPMSFPDVAPIEIPVTIGDKKYVLTEASEDAAVKISNARIEAARFGETGTLSHVKGAADVEPLTVSLCLFEANQKTGELVRDKEGFPQGAVSLGFVRHRIKPHIVKELYDRAIAISRLEEKETVTSLDKKITELQKKRLKLIEEQKKGSDPKDPPEGTESSSALPPG